MAGDVPSSVATGKYVRQVVVTAPGPQGAAGPQGATGAAGLSGGLSAPYKFSNIHTATDPGIGYLAFNNASIFIASSLYISEKDSLTDSQVGILDAAITSTNSNKAILTIQDSINTRKFSRYYVVEQSQFSAWRDLSVAYLDGTAQSWAYNDRLVLMVTPIGDAGTVGPAGEQGAPGIGIPAGGTDGQVLKKVGTSDYETEWVSPSIDASAISNLVDVVLSEDIDTLTEEQVLVFDQTLDMWVNRSVSGLQVSAENLSGTIIGGSASTF